MQGTELYSHVHACSKVDVYIYKTDGFTLDHKYPVTVFGLAKILLVKTWILADNCLMTDCYILQPC